MELRALKIDLVTSDSLGYKGFVLLLDICKILIRDFIHCWYVLTCIQFTDNRSGQVLELYRLL